MADEATKAYWRQNQRDYRARKRGITTVRDNQQADNAHSKPISELDRNKEALSAQSSPVVDLGATGAVLEPCSGDAERVLLTGSGSSNLNKPDNVDNSGNIGNLDSPGKIFCHSCLAILEPFADPTDWHVALFLSLHSHITAYTGEVRFKADHVRRALHTLSQAVDSSPDIDATIQTWLTAMHEQHLGWQSPSFG